MAIEPDNFEEFTKRFDKLPPEEREELIEQLQQRSTALRNESDAATMSLFDAMNRRGMAGSIKDAPHDWSTNPKYLEGLGQNAE